MDRKGTKKLSNPYFGLKKHTRNQKSLLLALFMKKELSEIKLIRFDFKVENLKNFKIIESLI